MSGTASTRRGRTATCAPAGASGGPPGGALGITARVATALTAGTAMLGLTLVVVALIVQPRQAAETGRHAGSVKRRTA